MSDRKNFPSWSGIIIPFKKVTHFTINFSQCVSFHYELWLWAKVTICSEIYIHNFTFTKYTFYDYVTFLDYAYVKIIKDYSLNKQTERSTYSRRSAQCRTLHSFHKPLNKIEKNTKDYLKNTVKLIKLNRLIKQLYEAPGIIETCVFISMAVFQKCFSLYK